MAGVENGVISRNNLTSLFCLSPQINKSAQLAIGSSRPNKRYGDHKELDIGGLDRLVKECVSNLVTPSTSGV